MYLEYRVSVKVNLQYPHNDQKLHLSNLYSMMKVEKNLNHKEFEMLSRY